MSNQGGIRAGLAFYEIYANDNALVKGLNAAQAKLKAFGNALKSVGIGLSAAGAGIVAPILASAKSFASASEALGNMSERTGVAVEFLSELGYAAEKTGTNTEELEHGIRHMQKTIFAATQQSEEAAQALAYLGLTAEKLKGLKPEQQFELIAEKINGIQDPTRKAAVAMQILGKSGTTLLPMLSNMKELRQEARDVGAVMSKEDVEAGSKLQGVFEMLKAALIGVRNAIGSAVAPVLTEYGTLAVKVVKGVSDFIRTHKEFIVTALKVGASIAAIGSALFGIGIGLVYAGSVAGAVATLISTGFAAAAAAVGALAAVLGALMSPIGVLFVALSALFAALIYFSGILGDVADAAQSAFDDVKHFALDCFSGIKDALMAGDIELAAQILWQSLKVVWKTGTNWLYEIWIGFARTFITAVDLVTGGIARAFDAAANFVYKTWNNVVGWFTKKIGEISAAVQNALAYFGIGTSVDVAGQNKRIDQHTQADNDAADRGLAERDAAFKKQIGMDQNYGSADIEANQKDLEKTKQELQGLIFGAHQEAADTAAKKQKGALAKIDTPEIDKLVKGTAIGTFNASAAGQLGIGSSANDRIAKATERANAILEEIENNTRAGGIVVS